MAFVFEAERKSIFDKKKECLDENFSNYDNEDLIKEKVVKKYYFIKKKNYFKPVKENDEDIDELDIIKIYLPRKIKKKLPSYAFNSNLNREKLFKDSNNLGPGQYNIPNVFDKYKENNKKRKEKILIKKDKKEEEKIKYYISHNMNYDKNKGFSMPKAKRNFDLKKNISDEDLPTNYTLNKKEHDKPYVKPSYFFSSNTQRNAFNLNIKKVKQNGENEFINNATPGPGYYESNEKNKINKKSLKYEIFNSGTDRFKIKKINKIPDPGQYHKDHNFNIKSFNKKLKNIYCNNTEKKNVLTKSFDYPGPGKYNLKDYFKENLDEIKNKEIFKNLIINKNQTLKKNKKFLNNIKNIITTDFSQFNYKDLKKPIKSKLLKRKPFNRKSIKKETNNHINSIDLKKYESKVSPIKSKNNKKIKFKTKNFISKIKETNYKEIYEDQLKQILNFNFHMTQKNKKNNNKKENSFAFNQNTKRFLPNKNNNINTGPGNYYNSINWNIESFNRKYN